MSPISIIFETFRSWARILSATIVIMGFVAALPGDADAAQRAAVRSALAATQVPAPEAPLLLPTLHPDVREPAPVSTRTVSLDFGGLPQSAFGDTDDAAR